MVESIRREVATGFLCALADERLFFRGRLASATELVEEIGACNLAEAEKAKRTPLLFVHASVLPEKSQGVCADSVWPEMTARIGHK